MGGYHDGIISVAWVINSPFEALSLTDCTGVIVWGWGGVTALRHHMR